MRIFFLFPCCITRQAESIYVFIKNRSRIPQWMLIGCILSCLVIICLNFDLILRDVGLVCSPHSVVQYVQEKCQSLEKTELADHPSVLKSPSAAPLNLCHQLCSGSADFASRIQCHGPQLAKASVFTLSLDGFHNENNSSLSSHPVQVVVKSSASNSFEEINHDQEHNHWSEASLGERLPHETDLRRQVEDHVTSFLGIHGSDGAVQALLQQVSSLHNSGLLNSKQSRQDLWSLISDQEFLMSLLMEKLKLFPKVLGTCGEFYGVEYVDTLSESFLISPLMPRNERLLKAIQLVQFVEKLDTVWQQPLHLCDVKMTHFGWTPEGAVRFVDVDTVMLESALVDRLQYLPECELDDDCSFFDCSAKCDSHAGKCLLTRTNTNLQVVCSRIFLGIVSPGVQLYGLLQFMDESEAMEDLLKEATHLCTTNPGMTTDTLLRVLRQAYTTQFL
ncbi:FAM69 protein-kinase domain [Trinorchestia longiramus]|nr:FAM69 protein-kinase domain [Trinorchestia longiramus]